MLGISIIGSVEQFKNRDELKEVIEEKGGKVTGSATSKTNYLINNDKIFYCLSDIILRFQKNNPYSGHKNSPAAEANIIVMLICGRDYVIIFYLSMLLRK